MKIKCSLLLLFSILIFNGGCALKSGHYGSMVDLQQEAMDNMSYQILDAIVATLDRSELPAFFYVESGQSHWAGSYNGNFAATIAPRWSADSTTLAPSVGTNENLGLLWQINDFGPAAMTRVTAIYEFLCYPLEIGNGILPNGALFTIIDEKANTDGFLEYVKRKNGNYIGVPEEKGPHYNNFMRDIVYWSRHANPDPYDLVSPAGKLYAFVVEYPDREVSLVDAMLAADVASNDYEATKLLLDEVKETIAQLEKNYQSMTQGSERVQTAIINAAYEQRLLIGEKLQADLENMREKQYQFVLAQRAIEQLLNHFSDTLRIIKELDPNSELIDINAIFDPFETRVEAILAKNQVVIDEVNYQMPRAAGIDARETFDKLYRDRFEALPLDLDSFLFQAAE